MAKCLSGDVLFCILLIFPVNMLGSIRICCSDGLFPSADFLSWCTKVKFSSLGQLGLLPSPDVWGQKPHPPETCPHEHHHLTLSLCPSLLKKDGKSSFHVGGQRAEAFVKAFLRRSMPHIRKEALKDQLQRKAVVLEYFTRRKRKEKKKKSKGLSARQRRELRLFDIKPEQQRYSLFLPLHELWKQYIRDLCNGLKPDTQPQMIQAKLLKADLHGAMISVTKSKCPSYVGVTGILLQETKHVFKIITKEDRLKVIPKLNCVFSVEIDNFISYIYGSKFQLRSSERSAKKFKAKGTIDL